MFYRSRSGRQKFVKPSKMLLGIVSFLLVLCALAAFNIAYSPLLHYYAGDPTVVLGTSANADSLWRKIQAEVKNTFINTLLAPDPPMNSEIPTVRLQANWTELAALNHEILRFHGGHIESKPKIKGLYYDQNGEPIPIKLGYRGTNASHHYFWKPSWQVRFRNSATVDGFSRHDFIQPEDGMGLRNWLSSELGDRWALLTYKETFVRLFLNGRYFGIYNRIWPLNSELLRVEGWSPGPIYRLEHATGPLFKRIHRRFWEPSHWEFTDYDPITAQRFLLSFLSPLMTQQTQKLNKVVDKEAMAKFLAIVCHGGSVHVDTHNVAFWLDLSRGKFVPILVDLNGYGLSGSRTDRPVVFAGNPFLRAYLEDPHNFRDYIDALWDLSTKLGSEESTLQIIDEQWQKIRPDALADIHISDHGFANKTSSRTHLAVTELDDQVENMRAFVRDRLAYLKASLQADKIVLLGQNDKGFQIAITGLCGTRVTRRDGKAISVAGRTQKEFVLLPTLAKESDELFTVYTLPGRPQDYEFLHRLNKNPLTPGPDPSFKTENLSKHGTHPWSIAPAPILSIEGDVFIEEDLEVEQLTVKAGSTIRMARDASIICRGPVTFKGTKEQPILVMPAQGGQSWGSIACIDDKAQISHTRFVSGGGDEVGLCTFEGSVALHKAEAILDSVTFENGLLSCLGSRRHRVNLTLRNSEFLNAAMALTGTQATLQGTTTRGTRYGSLIVSSQDSEITPPLEPSPSQAKAETAPLKLKAPNNLAQIKLEKRNYTDEQGRLQRATITPLAEHGIKLKFKSGPAAAGQKFIELWSPKESSGVRNWLPEHIAEELGLITAETEFVSLDGELRQRSLSPSEGLCIAQDVMPGTFFLPTDQDFLPLRSAWTSHGASPEDWTTVQQFFQEIRGGSSFKGLEKVLVLEDWAVWSAVAKFCGTRPGAVSGLYLSSYQGKLRPYLSRVDGFGLADTSDSVWSDVWETLEGNREWRAKRDQVLSDLQRDYSTDSVIALVKEELPNIDTESLNDLESWMSERRLARVDLTEVKPQPSKVEEVIWGPGEVVLEKDFYLSAHQKLLVKPDTRIILGPMVGLYLRGQVRVEGTAEKPVDILPQGNVPFACVGIIGPGTAGSSFEHLRVFGGSVGSDGGVRYKGMFNLYHCPTASFSHCQFGGNQIGDDAVNVAESQVTFENCVWSKARADALDLDRCQSVVRNCRFQESGNDGLDIMSGRAEVSGCVFEGSQDKGASVGEGSQLTIRESTFSGCEIGVQVKDNSEAKIQECRFSQNELDVDCYRKKPLFVHGGRAELESCTFLSEPKLQTDEFSEIKS